jgi:hypothetical protein
MSRIMTGNRRGDGIDFPVGQQEQRARCGHHWSIKNCYQASHTYFFCIFRFFPFMLKYFPFIHAVLGYRWTGIRAIRDIAPVCSSGSCNQSITGWAFETKGGDPNSSSSTNPNTKEPLSEVEVRTSLPGWRAHRRRRIRRGRRMTERQRSRRFAVPSAAQIKHPGLAAAEVRQKASHSQPKKKATCQYSKTHLMVREGSC